MLYGIDMNNTICSSLEKINEYQDIFIREENISVDNLWNNEVNKVKFFNKYLENIYDEAELKDGVVESINEFKKRGDEIYIVTARSEKFISSDINDIIDKYCKKNNLNVDKVFINSGDKVDVCINNNIDIMIEDNIYIIIIN